MLDGFLYVVAALVVLYLMCVMVGGVFLILYLLGRFIMEAIRR